MFHREICLYLTQIHISSINNIVRYLDRDDLRVIKASDFGLSRNISEKDGVNKENTRESAAAFKLGLTKNTHKQMIYVMRR